MIWKSMELFWYAKVHSSRKYRKTHILRSLNLWVRNCTSCLRSWTRQEAGITQFLTHKSTLLSISQRSLHYSRQNMFQHWFTIYLTHYAQHYLDTSNNINCDRDFFLHINFEPVVILPVSAAPRRRGSVHCYANAQCKCLQVRKWFRVWWGYTELAQKVCPRLRDSACWRSGEITQPRTLFWQTL